MADFKSKRVKIVVATDVAARGIDVSNITHVVNFGLPVELESYVHRIGRTGRAGKEGVACSILSPKQVGLLRRLEQKTGIKLQQFKPPSAESVVARAIGREILALMRPGSDEDFVRWEGAVREALRGGGMTSPAPELVSVLTKVMREKRPALFERQPLRELSEDRPQRPQQRGGGFGRSPFQRGGDRPRGSGGGGTKFSSPHKKRFGPQSDRPERKGSDGPSSRDGGRNSGGYGRPKSKSGGGGPRPKSGSRTASRSHS
jgi:ATP-dependent RNA helicase DeaD